MFSSARRRALAIHDLTGRASVTGHAVIDGRNSCCADIWWVYKHRNAYGRIHLLPYRLKHPARHMVSFWTEEGCRMLRREGCEIGTELRQTLVNIGYFVETKKPHRAMMKRKGTVAFLRAFQRWQEHAAVCAECRSIFAPVFIEYTKPPGARS